jgi:tRNA nucleotidyltransferase (CCA-adding enzyme)
LVAAAETLALCRTIVDTHRELPPERVREEWFKWASRSVVPSAGLRFLRDSGWWVHTPELKALEGVPQDPEWHPEGDAWTHTGHCVDALASSASWRSSPEPTRIVLMLAVLLHDVGKASCTREELRGDRMRIVSPGHEAAGVPMALEFLDRFGCPHAIRDRIPPLVANHMARSENPSPRMLRRLACRLAPSNIEELCAVMTAEFLAHQGSIGNDLSTPMPAYRFPGLLPGDRWCVTAVNWLRAHDDGCAAPVVLAGTHERTLDVVELAILKQHAVDIPDDLSGL